MVGKSSSQLNSLKNSDRNSCAISVSEKQMNFNCILRKYDNYMIRNKQVMILLEYCFLTI